MASCLINLCIGSMYAWSVFASPMAEHLNTLNTLKIPVVLTADNLTIVFAVAFVVSPIMTFLGGMLHDRFGPRIIIVAGGILFGSSMILSSFSSSLEMLVAAYGVGVASGNALLYICTLSNSVKFFPDRRGFAGGLITATYGLSSVILPPIIHLLIISIGVADTFRYIGFAFLCIVCASSTLIIRCPDSFIPEGWTPPTVTQNFPSSDKTWREMMADPIFYIMLLILCCGAVFGLMIVSQASSVARNMIGMSVTSATTVVSILALFNVAGRLCAGFISDKIGRLNMLSFMFVFTLVGLGMLYTAKTGDTALFYVGIAVVGICFGSFMGVYPGFTADQFGTKYQGGNYGIIFLGGFGSAGFVGPMLMTWLHETTGSYQPAFLCAGGLAVVGIVASCLCRHIIKARLGYVNAN